MIFINRFAIIWCLIQSRVQFSESNIFCDKSQKISIDSVLHNKEIGKGNKVYLFVGEDVYDLGEIDLFGRQKIKNKFRLRDANKALNPPILVSYLYSQHFFLHNETIEWAVRKNWTSVNTTKVKLSPFESIRWGDPMGLDLYFLQDYKNSQGIQIRVWPESTGFLLITRTNKKLKQIKIVKESSSEATDKQNSLFRGLNGIPITAALVIRHLNQSSNQNEEYWHLFAGRLFCQMRISSDEWLDFGEIRDISEWFDCPITQTPAMANITDSSIPIFGQNSDSYYWIIILVIVLAVIISVVVISLLLFRRKKTIDRNKPNNYEENPIKAKDWVKEVENNNIEKPDENNIQKSVENKTKSKSEVMSTMFANKSRPKTTDKQMSKQMDEKVEQMRRSLISKDTKSEQTAQTPQPKPKQKAVNKVDKSRKTGAPKKTRVETKAKDTDMQKNVNELQKLLSTDRSEPKPVVKTKQKETKIVGEVDNTEDKQLSTTQDTRSTTNEERVKKLLSDSPKSTTTRSTAKGVNSKVNELLKD